MTLGELVTFMRSHNAGIPKKEKRTTPDIDTAEPDAVGFRRADARRNHERVFAAALDVFDEHGLQATVPQVAERAGVGKATVYRSYPTRDALVEAVARHRFAAFERSVAAETVCPDPYDEFARQIKALFQTLMRDRLLAEVLVDRESPQAAALMDRYTRLMEAAKTSGKVRSDACVQDLQIMLCGPILQLMKIARSDHTDWHRYGAMFLQALR